MTDEKKEKKPTTEPKPATEMPIPVFPEDIDWARFEARRLQACILLDRLQQEKFSC